MRKKRGNVRIREKMEKNREVRKQECDSFFSLSTAYSLVRLKGSENKPFRPILSKCVISMTGFPCEMPTLKSVSLPGFNSSKEPSMAN